MILRHWKGVARPDRAEDYLAYLRNERFPHLSTIDGFLSTTITRRDVEQGVEFLILSYWESLDAIRQFAGEDAELAVVPPAVEAMMVSYEPYAGHYEVVGQYP